MFTTAHTFAEGEIVLKGRGGARWQRFLNSYLVVPFGFYGFDELERQVGRFPLLDELKILARLPGIEQDVILADDLRVVADVANPRWRPGEQGDYFVVREVSFRELTDALRPSHEAIALHQEEGILAFFPRDEGGI